MFGVRQWRVLQVKFESRWPTMEGRFGAELEKRSAAGDAAFLQVSSAERRKQSRNYASRWLYSWCVSVVLVVLGVLLILRVFEVVPPCKTPFNTLRNLRTWSRTRLCDCLLLSASGSFETRGDFL